MEIKVVQKVMKLNDELAGVVRTRLAETGTVAFNLMSAPGSGKTSLLETALPLLAGRLRAAVIEGDPETTLDAQRIARQGVPVVQIQTSGGCHLEAHFVLQALNQLDLSETQVLIIENVGNLVCPAEFDLGEAARIVMVSVPEGHDKPAKYPKLFRKADLVLLNKIDLLPYVDFDLDEFITAIADIVPGVPVITLSCKTGEGIDAWLEWLAQRVHAADHTAAVAS